MSESPDERAAAPAERAYGHPAVRVPDTRIGLSTAAVYPEGTATAFEMARDIGYDGVELMVWTDPVSQDLAQVADLSEKFAMPVLAIHAPCLLITQRVWSTDPWERLRLSLEAAARFGAPTVVVHPPFRWQREYARDFVEGVARLEAEHGIDIAVENMYPWRAGKRELPAYAPHWDPTGQNYAHNTLDLSHTAVSGTNALGMAQALGERLSHVHMADGTPSARDEHLVPGRGDQPCVEILELLARRGWSGTIILEIATRRAKNAAERAADLAEALAFTKLHFAAAIETAFAVGGDGTTEQIVRDPGR